MSIRHTAYHLHIGRVILGSLAFVAIGILHIPSLSPVIQKPDSPQVLAYATRVSTGDLTSSTNTARVENGLGGLSASSKLTVSAQLKANDMINKNYWSHVSPDGTQPWYWFGEAGYEYTNAGENLAYGFSTSAAVISAWMNSTGHKANILGGFQEVGFGIANGENYQGGQNTVVVAHYGTPRTQAPVVVAPVVVPPTSVPAPSVTTLPTPPVTANPAATTETPAIPQTAPSPPPTVATETRPETPAAAIPSPANNPAHSPVAVPVTATNIPAWQQLMSGSAPTLVLISVALLFVVGIGYVATHLKLVRHAAIMGEQYVLHHPIIDASVAAGATIFVLITTVGRIS